MSEGDQYIGWTLKQLKEYNTERQRMKVGMEALRDITKIREYCDYVKEHLLNVEKAWKILQKVLSHENVIYDDHLYFTIDKMIREHDLSKLSAAEFIPYQRNFLPVGEKDTSGFEAAWEHHKIHNPHHWQTWTELAEHFPNENACHCVCMVCDWMAMGMKFGDTAEEYYEGHKDKINLPEWAVKYVQKIFAALRASELCASANSARDPI